MGVDALRDGCFELVEIGSGRSQGNHGRSPCMVLVKKEAASLSARRLCILTNSFVIAMAYQADFLRSSHNNSNTPRYERACSADYSTGLWALQDAARYRRLVNLAKHPVAFTRKTGSPEGGQYELAGGNSYGNRDAMWHGATARRNLAYLDENASLRWPRARRGPSPSSGGAVIGWGLEPP